MITQVLVIHVNGVRLMLNIRVRMTDETMREPMDEYTEHADECMMLLEKHNLISFEEGKSLIKTEFQINKDFIHDVLLISSRYLLDKYSNNKYLSWSEVNEEIMKKLKISPSDHDTFVFALNSLFGTVLEQNPEILLESNQSDEEKKGIINTSKLILAGYEEMSKSIFMNMSEYR